MSVHTAATVCKLAALRTEASLQVEAAEKCFHVTEAFLQLTACLIRKGVHTATLQVPATLSEDARPTKHNYAGQYLLDYLRAFQQRMCIQRSLPVVASSCSSFKDV